MEIAKRSSEGGGGPLRLWPLLGAASHVLVKIMATQLELHLRLKGARWTMNGLNHSRGHNPRLLSTSKDPHRSSENNPNVRLDVQIIIFCISAFFGGLRLHDLSRRWDMMGSLSADLLYMHSLERKFPHQRQHIKRQYPSPVPDLWIQIMKIMMK